MAKMGPTAKFLVSLGVTAAAGYAAKVLYDRCTEEEKMQWREALPHHGEVGLLALIAGLASGNPVITGAGLGATVTDLDDVGEWFS